METESFKTPLGDVLVGAIDSGIIVCAFDAKGGVVEEDHGPDCGCGMHDNSKHTAKLLKATGKALASYFRGEIDALREIPVVMMGTPFQRAIWGAMRRIPAGKTKWYGEIATAAKYPNAVRAVGNACGANPLVLIVPCHRVVGSGGKMGGFSSGLHRKEFLLDHESALPKRR